MKYFRWFSCNFIRNYFFKKRHTKRVNVEKAKSQKADVADFFREKAAVKYFQRESNFSNITDEGIYSTIFPFWAHNGHMGGTVPEEWGIEGYSGNDNLWGVMFFRLLND